MKLAVSAMGSGLDDVVDPRFGRCRWFVLVDTETMELEAVENAAMGNPGGAGVASAQLVVSKGAKTVLTGNCGPNAYGVLAAAGINVVTGVGGSVRDAIEAYKLGRLQPSERSNVAGHFGMGHGWGGHGGHGIQRGPGM